MKTAVIYARYSCDAQSEQSIEGQMRVCEEYAKKNEIIILGSYVDRAMSGTNDMRPDFQRMIKDSAKKEWNYVLVYKLDRFSRNKYEAIIHKNTLKNNGVKVLSAMENIPDTPEGIILESLLEGMNQYYSAELAQKVRRGMRETRLKGLYQGGFLPIGYTVKDRKILIDEDNAKAVRFIFESYSNGITAKEIVSTLTSNGFLHKGKPLKLTTVYKIIQNERYTGSYTLNDEVVDNLYPQIISQELFDKVRKISLSNKHGGNSVMTTYLLRKKMTCAHCGEHLIGERGLGRNKTHHFYYKCRGRKCLNNGCKLPPFEKSTLEGVIIDKITESLSTPENIEFITRKILEIQEENFRANSLVLRLEKEKNQNETAINNILGAIEQGAYSPSTIKRLHQLEDRQTELEALILKERSKIGIKINAADIKAFYKEALKSVPQILINHLVKSITVSENEIRIYFNSPIERGPDESQGFSFYEKFVTCEKFNITVKILI